MVENGNIWDRTVNRKGANNARLLEVWCWNQSPYIITVIDQRLLVVKCSVCYL